MKTALGGFISFIGFIILVSVFLTGTNATDIRSVFQDEITIGVVALIGFLDVFCGFLLIFREKR